MCGRFTNRMSWAEIHGLYNLVDWSEVELTPRYNAAPMQQLPVVVGQPAHGELMSWGIKGAKGLIVNAKSETVSKLPTFRDAFRQRRCLVPADGFYEWKVLAGERYPYYFTMHNEEPFCFAGIYNPEGFSLMTTTPNAVVAEVHDRMPVILPREAYHAWLDPATEEADLKALLGPYPAEEMQTHPVSRRVNKVVDADKQRIDGAGLIVPVKEERGLF